MAQEHEILPSVLFFVWGSGFLLVLTLWLRRWLGIRAIVRNAARCEMAARLRVLSSPALLEPAVFGIFKPVLLLPEGLLGRLTAKELQAIYAHELCHLRHQDNLAARFTCWWKRSSGFIRSCGGWNASSLPNANAPVMKMFCARVATRWIMPKGFWRFASFVWRRRYLVRLE
ncbi:MAG TPA: M56 family metallopeptidase [Bryobacteraceae bacterium]|nr:M56 family metallopeptidase [Bryobacteraceae bacterium]